MSKYGVFDWFVFCRIRTEYRDLKTPYLDTIQAVTLAASILGNALTGRVGEGVIKAGQNS